MVFKLDQHRDELLFVPLGGSSEIGMNLNLYHFQGKWLMVDFGIGFADSAQLPGVDVIVPNIEFLNEIKHDIVGLILTHAHEDHVGAAAYLWEDLVCPVYTTAFTAAFLRAKLANEGLTNKGKAKINEVQLGAQLQLGPFSVELVGLTHSIPEMNAIAIGTEAGVVIHTGDWKFDPDPLVGAASDVSSLQRYGKEGVLAMVCDSTNVFVEGRSGSESTVRSNLIKEIEACDGRVFVTTFASNVARLETICEAASETGRSVVLAGRSLWRITDSAREAGYLTEYNFLSDEEAQDLPHSKQLIICTGCQGEALATLPKLIRGDHRKIKLSKSDTVIYSARIIPGNEKRINYVQNNLVRMGIEVINDEGDTIHVSGHPAREELAEMYTHIRPKIAVPVHGEARHIHEHAKFARSLQVPVTLEPYNGAVLRLSGDSPQIVGEVTSGYVAIDGNTMLDIDSPVIRMRRRMQDAGIVTVSMAVDTDYALLADPSISAPGSLDPTDDADLIDGLKEELELTMERLPDRVTEEKVKQAIRTTIRRMFKREVGKKPIIMVELLKVA
ncbi:MAG: ribonuclease J [Alphaproteobacteria bacterium]|nr:ribonuclease J [Alphaproteobacteria bacterium]